MSKPMTPETLSILREMADRGRYYPGSGTGNASRVASLRARGFAWQDGMGGVWSITEAGRAHLEQIDGQTGRAQEKK